MTNSPLDNARALRAAAARVVADLECPHISTEHGNCTDCMNRGTVVTCQEEADLLDAADAVMAATKDLPPHDALTEHHTPEQSTALSPDYRRAAGICVAALDLADLDEHGDRVTLNRIINHTISDGLRAALGFPCVDGDNLHAFVLRTLDLTDPVDPRDAEIARLRTALAQANRTITDLQEHR